MSKARNPSPPTPLTPYVPTARERPALEAQLARGDRMKPAPRLKLTKAGTVNEISFAHRDRGVGHLLLMEAIGTANADFLNGLLKQLVNISTQGHTPDEGGINFVLSVIKGVEPRDQTEALLAAQMAAIHVATMTFARRLAHVETIPQQDSAERALNKLTRTFAMQVEALKRYRSGGEQKVVVQHVHVGEGGQAAVVGAIAQGGGDRGKYVAEPHAPPARLADYPPAGPILPALRRPNAERRGMPVASDARQGPLPSPRRRQHRATDG